MYMNKKKLFAILILIAVLSALWIGIQALKKWNEGRLVNQSESKITFNVYFSNSEMSAMEDCSEVFPVERTVSSTEAIGTAALSELLKGPTGEEKNEGYFTSLPDGVVLNSLNIEESNAYADFNEALNQGGGSCMMENRRAQITETLKQFPTVDSVIISVNGDTETALQP